MKGSVGRHVVSDFPCSTSTSISSVGDAPPCKPHLGLLIARNARVGRCHEKRRSLFTPEQLLNMIIDLCRRSTRYNSSNHGKTLAHVTVCRAGMRLRQPSHPHTLPLPPAGEGETDMRITVLTFEPYGNPVSHSRTTDDASAESDRCRRRFLLSGSVVHKSDYSLRPSNSPHQLLLLLGQHLGYLRMTARTPSLHHAGLVRVRVSDGSLRPIYHLVHVADQDLYRLSKHQIYHAEATLMSRDGPPGSIRGNGEEVVPSSGDIVFNSI